MKFTVHMTNQVSTGVEVDADSLEEAMEKVWESDDCPGSITIGAFGAASVDDSDWNIVEVYDGDGQLVFKED